MLRKYQGGRKPIAPYQRKIWSRHFLRKFFKKKIPFRNLSLNSLLFTPNPHPLKSCVSHQITIWAVPVRLCYWMCRLVSNSRGHFRPSRTITLTIYELVAPDRPLGALRPMLTGCGPSSPTQTAPNKPKYPNISKSHGIGGVVGQGEDYFWRRRAAKFSFTQKPKSKNYFYFICFFFYQLWPF